MKYLLQCRLIISALMLSVMAGKAPGQISPWEPMNRGLLHLLVYAIEIDPTNPLVMYAGTEYGNLYKTTDGGFNWILRRDGIPKNYNTELITALKIDRRNPGIVYAGFGGRASTQNLFKSTDGAGSWAVMTTPPEWKNGGVLYIHKALGSRDTLHVVQDRLYCGLGWGYGVHATWDESSWKKILGNSGVQAIAGPAHDTGLLFIGSSSVKALQCSTNEGNSWRVVQIARNQDAGTGVRSICFSPVDSSTVYVGVTGSAVHGLFKSTDMGESWTQCNSIGEISEIAVHPQNPEIIYISAIGSGVHRTTDGGKNWSNLKDGMPTTNVMRVRVAPGYPVQVFAVTLQHGIFRLVDEELTAVQLERR